MRAPSQLKAPLRVVLADDHAMVRRTTRAELVQFALERHLIGAP